MSRDGYRGPKLPSVLLDKVQSGGISKNKRDVSRKDQRKADRQAKTQSHRPPQVKVAASSISRKPVSAPRVVKGTSTAPARTQPAKDAKPAKSILKKTRQPEPEPESQEETDVLDEDETGSDEESEVDMGAPEPEDINELTVSRPTKRKLEEDDAEIAALERKLGIKGKKSRALEDDGLDWLTGGGSGSEDEQRPGDMDWLKSKRRKASAKVQEPSSEDESEGEDDALDQEDLDVRDDFEVFESEADEDDLDDQSPPPPRKKENPYVAPGVVHGISSPAAKYVPPSLRKAASSDEGMLRQLHRQVQGKVNKVSEANLVSILKEVEDIYKDNARQHVTSTLIDILIGLMTADVAHADTVLITNAAFATAVYKVIGTDFGAQLLERIVERYDHFNGRGIGDAKQPLNLLAFLSYLYNFQVVGCAILFDYIRSLLAELTEPNTEMLLRVMRISGQQLRQDDPSALKDIVMLVQKLVTKTGEDNLSVRTKFMIETINNLKNNRMKTGLAASAIAAEQTTRMKKTLGTLNSRAKATEPLRITLADINDTEKKGKWWLVGASYHDPSKLATSTSTTLPSRIDDEDQGYQSETPGSVNLTKLAKQRGMNTDVRRAIFISLLSGSDVKDAQMRLVKLRLKNKQQLEIPRVVLSCVGGEEAYNSYYALVARKFCADRAMRKAWQFVLWGFWREIEGEGDVEDSGDAGEGGAVGVRRVINLAKFYAALVADGSLSLAILKKLEFAGMPAKESMFAEVFVTSVLFQLRKSGAKTPDADEAFETSVRKVFAVAGAPEMLSGMQYFVRNTVQSSDLARTKKEVKALDIGCRVALEALREAEKSAPADDLDSEDDGGDSD